MSVESELAPYPGRAVVHHVAPDGSTGWVYVVTGRSRSSLKREIRRDGESLVVSPTDPDLPADVLRHYRCVIRAGIG